MFDDTPMSGAREKMGAISAPAPAASAAPTPKASVLKRRGLIPTIAAESRDWLTASSACPQIVRFMK